QTTEACQLGNIGRVHDKANPSGIQKWRTMFARIRSDLAWTRLAARARMMVCLLKPVSGSKTSRGTCRKRSLAIPLANLTPMSRSPVSGHLTPALILIYEGKIDSRSEKISGPQ